MTIMMSRRVFASGLGIAAAGILARPLRAAAPPKETGLSSEGLLVGRPGFQPRTVMPLPHSALPGFLSAAQLAAHHAEYVRDVERLRDAEARLRDPELAGDRYVEARRAQIAAANAMLLHELYFRGLAPATVMPPRHIARNMAEHMGSWESWRDDFTRCALAAKAWATLVYDPYDDRWHNAVMDGDDDGVWIGANPLVVCDVAPHAFAQDHSRRDEYVAKFLDHVDWEEVSRRYASVDRM